MKYSCEELVRKMNLKPLQLLACSYKALQLLKLSVYSLKEDIRNDNKTINKSYN